MENHSLPAPGDIVGGRYRILRTLGEGGMGIVYEAADTKLEGRRWAVKAARIHEAALMEEARLLTQLKHPQLPHIVDLIPAAEAGCSFVVMELVEGETLQQMFERNHRFFPFERAIDYAVQLCDILAYLHDRPESPVIYRDLKPSNVIVDSRNLVRLIDFGAARSYKPVQIEDTARLGSVGFAAPEQFAGSQTDHRTDLYALGAMLYYLLSGGTYYSAAADAPFSRLNESVPKRFSGVLAKLLAAEPEYRYQSSGQLRTDLETFLPTEKRRRRRTPSSSAPPKPDWNRACIAVIGMYSGAGATFVTFCAARALNRRGIPHAAVEYAGNDPEWFQLLFGERSAPAGYVFYDEAVLQSQARPPILWQDGFTVWYPLKPEQHPAAMRKEQWIRFLHSCREPVVLVDVSVPWHRLEVDDLRFADEIWFVADSCPSKLTSGRLRQLQEFQEQLHSSGCQIRWIANRDFEFRWRKDWVRHLPARPVCIVPDLPYFSVVESLWEGKLIQDHPAFRDVLDRSLAPLLTVFQTRGAGGGAKNRAVQFFRLPWFSRLLKH